MVTTTLAPPELDLSWVTVAKSGRDTECTFADCHAQATHIATFRIVAVCTHPRRPYCLVHREYIVEQASICHRFFCRTCGPESLLVLLRMEPLR